MQDHVDVDLGKQNDGVLKEPSPIFSTFFRTFGDFDIIRIAHIFLITHCKFHSWKAFYFEDINENVPDYGNHN